jgi:carbon monoxide dehydrogenase subunit G
MTLFIVDVLEPTEVIEAKVHGLRLAHIATEQATVRAHEVDRLVADVEDAMLIGQNALLEDFGKKKTDDVFLPGTEEIIHASGL